LAAEALAVLGAEAGAEEVRVEVGNHST
jgi:hypothetical protein